MYGEALAAGKLFKGDGSLTEMLTFDDRAAPTVGAHTVWA